MIKEIALDDVKSSEATDSISCKERCMDDIFEVITLTESIHRLLEDENYEYKTLYPALTKT